MKCLNHSALLVCSGILLAALFTALVLLPAIAAADAPPALRFDPFGSRPVPEARQRGAGNEVVAFTPVLLSTIVRGNRSLVNLGGKILALEEETQGYRLLEVRAFDALFLKDGQEIRIEVVRPESDPS